MNIMPIATSRMLEPNMRALLLTMGLLLRMHGLLLTVVMGEPVPADSVEGSDMFGVLPGGCSRCSPARLSYPAPRKHLNTARKRSHFPRRKLCRDRGNARGLAMNRLGASGVCRTPSS